MIVRLPHPGERNQLQPAAPWLAANHLRQLDPVQVRHVEVDEGHVARRRLRLGNTREIFSPGFP